jgi:quercetin dioxygenase-like cupin family protein
MKFKAASQGEVIVREDYSKKIIFNLEDFNNTGHLLQTVNIPPNTKQRQHFHHKQTEVFYILEGECIININGEDFTAKPGDSFICEPKDKHYLWNKSDCEFKLLVFKIDLSKDEDTVWESN